MYSALTSKQKLSGRRIWNALIRKKTMDKSRMERSELRRALDLVDLTTIGIANTFGLGVYVFAGIGARVAGPAICLAHFIVGVATTLTALCYGELAAAVPRSGSVYSYTYALMGEFMAFIIGWLQCLENVIGVACLAEGLSIYINNMIDNKLADYFAEVNIPVVLAKTNIFAVLLIAICSCILVGGVELTVTFQKLLTFLNLTTLTIIIVIGVCNADLKNWSWKPGDEDFPTDGSGGSGGFFPFGFHALLVISRQGVYAYRGFECITCAGEETKNPRKLLPLAILLTLIIASVSYIGVAVALTLMWPYFDESVSSPFPYALDMTNMHNVKWVVSTGILFCLCACLLGNTYHCTRLLYCVGTDGIIFRWFGKVNSKTKTPILSTIATAILSGAFLIIFNADDEVRTMVCIINLVSHTVVSVCVLLLRYRTTAHEESAQDNELPENWRSLMEMLLNLKEHCKTPTAKSYFVVKMTIIVLPASSMFSIIQLDEQISNFESSLIAFCFVVIGFCIVVLMRQPQSLDNLPFKVPFVPLLPVASLLFNIFLMMAMLMSEMIWLMLLISTPIGLLIYFGYTLKHSVEAGEKELSLSNFSSPQSNSANVSVITRS